MDKQSYIFLAEGFEEIEALTVVDVLRRASMPITTVSITENKAVTGAHGVTVEADCTFADADFSNAAWLIVPGGLPGSTNLAAFKPLGRLLKAHANTGGFTAAICAAPAVVLAPLGLLDHHQATGYPGTTTGFPEVNWVDAPAVRSGNIVTGNGPASALRFALAIVEAGTEASIAQAVGSGMLFYPHAMNPFIQG